MNTCTGPNGELGPRGAADDTDLARQQAKIVKAINGLKADVVSLEEIENSAKFGEDRDAAVSTLVDALNAEAGAGTWKFVPSPSTAGDQADEDVIRTAFIYRAARVEPIGESVIDDASVFDVARDPLAQAFEPVGGTKYSRFVVIVNHFKSKGSGPDDGTGQGDSNPQRVAQAEELVDFADRMKSHLGTDKVFLSGDFNAYTREDPLQKLYDAGYTDIGSDSRPTSTPTSSTTPSALSTTCSATRRRCARSPAHTSGTSARWSRWRWSTAATTTTRRTSTSRAPTAPLTTTHWSSA